MTRYKLRLPGPGDYIYCESETVYVGDTAADAHKFYVDEAYEEGPEFWVHPEILRGRCVYARDIENGECHEDAEPGDTTFDYVARGDAALRPLAPGEIRTWPRGTWSPGWCQKPPWCSAGSGYEVAVAGEIIGSDYADQIDARSAREQKVAELVEEWKAAHPEYRCDVPTEEDE